MRASACVVGVCMYVGTCSFAFFFVRVHEGVSTYTCAQFRHITIYYGRYFVCHTYKSTHIDCQLGTPRMKSHHAVHNYTLTRGLSF